VHFPCGANIDALCLFFAEQEKSVEEGCGSKQFHAGAQVTKKTSRSSLEIKDFLAGLRFEQRGKFGKMRGRARAHRILPALGGPSFSTPLNLMFTAFTI
jgi:hypothetical protein